MSSAEVDQLAQVQSYWDRRPCNIRHSNETVGTKKYFDEVEKRKYFVEPHIPEFAKFEQWRDKNVLEIGCGIGTDAVNFARHGANYTGIELSTESLKIAKKRFDLFNLNGKFISCNAERLDDHLSEKFDLIYSFGVIHHTPNPRDIICASRKVIESDGELRIMLYAKHSWKSAMIGAGLDQPEAQSGCPIASVYSEQDVVELLSNKFKIIEIQQDHIFPYIVEKYRNFEYELTPWFKSMPTKVFRALEKSLGWHLLIKAKPI